MSQLAKYAKALVPLALAGLTALHAALSDNGVSVEEWKVIGSEILAAAIVWLVPNKPSGDVAPPR